MFVSGNEQLIDVTSIGTGIKLKSNQESIVQNCCLQHLRIGLDIVNPQETLKLVDVKIEKCSIASQIQEMNQVSQSIVVVANFESLTCYYGLMLDLSSPTQVYLSGLKFQDVPKCILVSKTFKALNFVTDSEYLFPRLSDDVQVSDLEESELEEKMRRHLYLEFSSKEKIPFRIAYQHEDFIIISRLKEELAIKL